MVEPPKRRAGDVAALDALLELDTLTEVEEKVFADMARKLKANPALALTDKQRQWVDSAAEKHDIALGATNDVSEGLVAPAPSPMDFSAMGPMVLQPPGRRRLA